MTFDYFYGSQSESFSFYRIPRLLITEPTFKRLSSGAKLLYGLLLDRMGLSVRSGWYDEKNRPNDAPKVVLLSDLEKEYGSLGSP